MHGNPPSSLAQGDTTTVMTTALACFYRHIPFGHVEAGLRTHDLRYPWPEEMNRLVAGHLATVNFAPTETAQRNLLREGVDSSRIHRHRQHSDRCAAHHVREGSSLVIRHHARRANGAGYSTPQRELRCPYALHMQRHRRIGTQTSPSCSSSSRCIQTPNVKHGRRAGAWRN